MRKTVIIPTYWCRPKGEPWLEGDQVYDHPTYVDEEGTLGNTLESMKMLEARDFKLVILVCPTTPDVEKEAEQQVINIVEKSGLGAETYIFTSEDLRRVADIFREQGVSEDVIDLLSLNGYANVRNICLLTACILSSDAAILIDDDEIFELHDFMIRAVEFLGKRVYGDVVHGVAGYYLNKHNQYYDDVKTEPWMTYWDRFGAKARAFDKIIGCNPRIKKTPFAFGGAMVIHRELYESVPFDPMITRGEDIDYLINSKMFGFDFFLDNTLSIKHLPVPKKHPQWKRLREDIYRFVYERAKITSQYESGNMTMITPEDFDPYPGEFLKADLDDKIYRSNMMLATQYLAEGDSEGCEACLKNIYISKYEAPPDYDPFTKYRKTQRDWAVLTRFVVANRYEIRKIMERHNLTETEIIRDNEHNRKTTPDEIESVIRGMAIFKDFSSEEIAVLRDFAQVKTYYENEQIFASGDYITSVYAVTKGRVVLFDQNPENPSGTLEVGQVPAGEMIGESALIHDIYRLNAFAGEFTEMLSIRRVDLSRVVNENPEMGVKLLKIMLTGASTKLDVANRRLRERVQSDQRVEDSAILELE